jgi:YbbR domain-containing protein
MNDVLKQLWNGIRKDKWLLLICFFLAFLAWQGIRKNIGFEVSVSNISVDVDVPEGWAVWEKSVHQVNVLFRGSREDIRYLNNEQLKVVIPVSRPKKGNEMRVVLSEKYLKNPTDAKVVRFSPSEILVKLDQEGERVLPVKAALNGSLPEGLEVDRIVCSPATVKVSGARQVLDNMDNIHTEPISLNNRQSSFKESIRIALPQAGRMKVEPDWVSVDFFLVQRTSNQIFENIPVRILCESGDHRSFSIQPHQINITVKGLQQRIEQMKSADMFAYVSCTDLDQNTGYDLPVRVDLPQGLQLVSTEPGVVHVDVNAGN